MKKLLVYKIFIILLFFITSSVFAKEQCKVLQNQDVYYSHYASDPINVKNLNFYYPSQDLHLPCVGLPLEIFRAYNSFSKYNGPFGMGWAFKYDVHVEEKRGYIALLESDGSTSRYMPFHLQDKFKNKLILKIIKAIKANDKKSKKHQSKAYYDKIKRRLQQDAKFYDDLKMKWLVKGTPKVGKYISYSRGKNILHKKLKGYVREYPDGKKEYFSKKGRLTRKVDKFKNSLRFGYKGAQLISVTDSCARTLTIAYNSFGKIETITDPLGRKISYFYKKRGNWLVKVVDIEGKITTFGFTAQNQINRITYPGNVGSTINEYNNDGRVKVQIGPNKLRSEYERRVDPKNKNHSWSIVTNNQGYWRRYDYYNDEFRSVTTYKDKSKKISKLDPVSGKPLSITDEKGRGIFFQYDGNFNLISRTDSDGVLTEYTYDPKTGLPSSITTSDNEAYYYHYNVKGDISWAYDKNGHFLKVGYYPNGKHKSVSNTLSIAKRFLKGSALKNLLAKRKENKIKDVSILFEYDKFGFASKIDKKGISFVKSQFDQLGEVKSAEAYHKGKKVEQDKKQAIIDDIRRTYADLLSPLRPAGIKLEI